MRANATNDSLDQPDLRSAGHFLRWLARWQWQGLALGALLGATWMCSLAALPLVLGGAVEAATQKQPLAVIAWSAGVLALGAFGAGAGVLRHRRAVFNFLTAASRVQGLIIRASARLGGDLPKHVAAGEVASLSATDVDRIGYLFDMTGRFSGAVISYLGVTAVLFALSPEFGAVAALGGPVTMGALVCCLLPLNRRQTVQREAIAGASGLAVDVVAGLRIVRGLGGEAVFASRFAAATDRVRAAMVRTAQMEAVLLALEVVIPGGFLVAVTWIGGSLAESGRATPGQLVTVYAFAAFLLVPLATFGQAVYRFSAGLVASRRVLSVLSMERDLGEAPECGEALEALRPEKAGLVLEDTASGLRFEPGQLSAVTAVDPEELSSLASRLGRFEDPEPGSQVTLGGVPLAQLPLSFVRQHVLVVDREAALLAGTIGDAVDLPALGERTTRRPTVSSVLEAAGATEVIEGLPEGLEHQLPERGRSLSGGQRQRLVLARALRVDPEILVLEEPTSAVDAHTEAEIAHRLADLRRGRTTVVLTASPLLLEQADSVFVLDRRVVANGTHRQLASRHDWYRQQLQLEDSA